MADIRTENIIYNITTQKNELEAELNKSAKGVESLESELKDLGKDGDEAFKTLQAGAKQYEERLKQATQRSKELDTEIRKQTVTSKQLQRELEGVNDRLKRTGTNTVEFQNLTKKANELKTAIQSTNASLKDLKVDKSQVDQSIRSLAELAKQARESGKASEITKDALNGIGDAAKNATPQLSGVIGILQKLGPLGAVAGAGLGAIGGAFTLAKNRIQEFSDDVDVFTDRISVRWRRVGDTIAEAFVQAVNGGEGFSKTLDKLDTQVTRGVLSSVFGRKAADEVTPLIDQFTAFIVAGPKAGLAAKKAAQDIIAEEKRIEKEQEQLTRLRQERERVDIENIVIKKELELEIAKSRAEFEESRTEGVKNEEALNRLIEANNKLEKIRTQEAQKRLEIQKGINGLTLSNNADKRNEKILEAELLQIAADRENAQRTIEKLKRFNPKETKAEIDANNQIIEQLGLIGFLRQQIAEQQKALTQATSVDEALAITAVTDALQRELTEIENVIKAFQDRLANPDQGEAQAIGVLFGVKGGIDGIKQIVGKAFNTIQKAAKDKEQRIIDVNNLKREVDEAIQVYSELSRSFIQQDIERKDAQIRIQQDRVNEFRRIAERGNAEQLELEEERLNKLLEAREQAAQRERAIAALQIAAANAVAIAEGIKNVVKGFSDPIKGIANAVALASAVGATILAIRNATSSLPAFAEGTEYVDRGKFPKGKDTIIARVNEGERILTTEQNRQLKGISNDRLVEIVKDYNNRPMVDAFKPMQQRDNTPELIASMQSVKRSIDGLSMEMNVNEYGLTAGISRAQTRINRRKNLAR